MAGSERAARQRSQAWRIRVGALAGRERSYVLLAVSGVSGGPAGQRGQRGQRVSGGIVTTNVACVRYSESGQSRRRVRWLPSRLEPRRTTGFLERWSVKYQRVAPLG